MKIVIRFLVSVMVALIAFLLLIGILMVVMFEGVFPALGIEEAFDNFGFFLSVCIFSFLTSGGIFSFYFARPIIKILKLIEQLSSGQYPDSIALDQLHDKKGNVRYSYRLYREVIADLSRLSDTLHMAEQKRVQLAQAKRNWISGVSHDLKTPLSYITGYSTMLLSEEHDWTEEEQHQFLIEINAKGKVIEDMINDLNLIFRLENADQIPLRLSEAAVCKLAQAVIADVASSPRTAAYNLEFTAPDLNLKVMMDERLLVRALQNLLMNAIEHNPAGTAISTTVKAEGSMVRVIVEDNGRGIAPELLQSIFSRYTREESHSGGDTSGRGLGLSVVKSIAEAHGGKVEIESEVGKGTRICICLPKEN